MPTSIIVANTKNTAKQQFPIVNNTYLEIAEMFCDTIQGEGISIGVPAIFMRLKGCVLSCKWCDTTEVWKQGDRYTFEHLYALMQEYNVIEKLKNNHRLIITGGSPLKQQKNLISFLVFLKQKIKFLPFIEIENECVIKVNKKLISFISQWNNSPKLYNSNMKLKIRYQIDVIKQCGKFKNSWFKFVIDKVEDWEEIESNFLTNKLILRTQIILMPNATNQKELNKKRLSILNLAIQKNVRFSDRLHITIFDKKTGV